MVSSPSSVCKKPSPKTPAFKTSMSSEEWCFKNCAANVRTDDKELRSRCNGEHRACPRSLRILPTACSALDKSRHARITWHPWRARLLAVSNPIPVLAPVTMATRVDKSSPWRICSEDVLRTINTTKLKQACRFWRFLRFPHNISYDIIPQNYQLFNLINWGFMFSEFILFPKLMYNYRVRKRFFTFRMLSLTA